jgi:hypothetical protein
MDAALPHPVGRRTLAVSSGGEGGNSTQTEAEEEAGQASEWQRPSEQMSHGQLGREQAFVSRGLQAPSEQRAQRDGRASAGRLGAGRVAVGRTPSHALHSCRLWGMLGLIGTRWDSRGLALEALAGRP